MKNKAIPFFIFMLFISSLSFPQNNLPKGNLVIVGGGLEADNASVFNTFIQLAGGNEKATIAVIPSASGVPVQTFESFKNILAGYGVKPSNIRLIKIAMVDDDSTLNFDESTWKENGNDPKLAEMVRKCSGVWFSGGDQLRTLKTLVKPNGSKSLVLNAVWEVYKKGGVIGGTSAGAAIMSDDMIGGGNSISALCNGVVTNYEGDDYPESKGVLLTKGLGFFPSGLVDQHFNARTRIGRLAVALMHLKSKYNLGFGIDENTALIYLGKESKLKVAGKAGVTIINTKNAIGSSIQKLQKIENLMISYMEEGDGFDILTGAVIPEPGKKATRGNEYYSIKPLSQTGILSGSPATFRDLITRNLIDNNVAEQVQNLSLYNGTEGYMVSFSKLPQSAGFYIGKPDDNSSWTVTDIRMDIFPVKISISNIH